jgi:hypothetical protein
MHKLGFIAIIIGCSGFSLQTRADFVNNVESFPGTSFDLSTWHIAPSTYASIPGLIAQNNGLSMDTRLSSTPVAYSTNNPLVTAGTGVRAAFTLHDFTAVENTSNAPTVSLYLASQNIDFPFFAQHSLTIGASEFTTNVASVVNAFNDSIGTESGNLFTSQLQLEHLYYLQIFRTSQTGISFSFLDGNGQLLASSLASNNALPASMYVSLYSDFSSISFNRVALISSPSQPVPEPGSLAILGLASVVLMKRRRRWI